MAIDVREIRNQFPPFPCDCIAWLNGFFLKEHRFIKYIYRNNFRKQALNLATG